MIAQHRAGDVVPSIAGRLADGDWHRLHPASPLLKGGIALIAVIGVVVANLREHLIALVIPGYAEGGDPLDYVIDQGFVGYALLAVLALTVVLVVGFYFSWRMHTFRITNEVVEVRSGILFRTNRKARLDRIQGINIVRPFIARLFGTARMEINQAGQDANVQLAYLSGSAADDLRREILRLASGTRAAAQPAPAAGAATVEGFVERRVAELIAPELDPHIAPPESVVTLGIGRLAGSILLSGTTLFVLLLGAAGTVGVLISGQFLAFLWVVPVVIGTGGYLVSRFLRSLRYSIAGTADGVRVGFGLLTTSNETLPPGRIHSVQIGQPLLWRAAGWWEIKVNRASQSTAKGAAGQANTTILPVGDRADVVRVLGLLLPGIAGDDGDLDGADLDGAGLGVIERGLLGRGEPGDGFTTSPRRAAWLRWFSWRRNGFALSDSTIVLRRGVVWRELVLVPAPRVQSVSVEQGPIGRATRLATVHLHTVAGPISARLGALDVRDAVAFFAAASALVIDAAAHDRSHRWRSDEMAAAPREAAPSAPATGAQFGDAAESDAAANGETT